MHRTLKKEREMAPPAIPPSAGRRGKEERDRATPRLMLQEKNRASYCEVAPAHVEDNKEGATAPKNRGEGKKERGVMLSCL